MMTRRALFPKRLTPMAELMRLVDPKKADELGPYPNYILESRKTARWRCREGIAAMAARLARRGAGSEPRRSGRRRLGRTLFQRKWIRQVEMARAAAPARDMA
jgi:hypothetical protein